MSASRLTRSAITLDPLLAEVAGDERGGTCVFVGTVRNGPDEAGVVAIEYSAYPEMAEAELERILAEAHAAHPGARAAACHRLGDIPVGDASVAVVAAAPHRDAAFAACRFVIEEIKRRLPVWKKERRVDGTTAWLDSSGRPVPADEVPR